LLSRLALRRLEADPQLSTRRPVRRSPLEWAESRATIVHPVRGRIPFVPYLYQRAFLASYDAPRRIMVKARQIGYSLVFALEALYAAIHEAESTILLVSRSEDLAINLLRYCYQAYSSLVSAPALAKQNEGEMGFVNGSRIKSIPANRTTGRGFAATRVYLDEFAYAQYAEDIYQSISPAVAQGGSLTIGSTPNGAGNLFHELFMTGNGFVRQQIPWHECPSYYTGAEQAAGIPPKESAWYREQRPNHTAQAWAAEYECDFIGSGLGLFNAADIDRAAAACPEPAQKAAGDSYITTVDVGRRRDATVINTFDVTALPYTRVAFDRLEHVPYPLIQQAIEVRTKAYPGTTYVESNGIGDPVVENLNVAVVPFVTTAKSKMQALQALQLLFEQGNIRARWDRRERAALISCAWDEAHTADEVMSLAIFAAAVESRLNASQWLRRYDAAKKEAA
jgi:hypothetical protein